MVELCDSAMNPRWPIPDSVGCLISLRGGGVSEGPFASNNLARHVGDNDAHVLENRERLKQLGGYAAEPLWLHQVHGTDVVYAPDCSAGVTADGSFSDKPGVVCAVLTADCLPVMLCSAVGDQVAAVHAGWRGLCAGVLRSAVARFSSDSVIMAYLGPAIGRQAFQVGAEVKAAFTANAKSDEHRASLEAAFVPCLQRSGFYRADLYSLARTELNRLGVKHIFGHEHCTVADTTQCYSYRRDSNTGRHASIIWIK